MAESIRNLLPSKAPPGEKSATGLPASPGKSAVAPRACFADGATFQSETAALRDLTRLYLKALEGQRAKDSLLAVAAHELRHPLQLMRMGLERYLPQPQDPARESLERYINRMARLVDDLVDFIRSERDQLQLEREWVDLDRLLVELVEDYQSTFAKRKVRLSVDSPAPLFVDADAHRLLQVFSNLLDNALKFTPSGGSVTVTVARAGRRAAIRVRDTGRGVAADILPRVLDLPSDLASPHGLGIGLVVARRITELHGGSIVVRSDGPGKGTEVVVTLPALDDPS